MEENTEHIELYKKYRPRTWSGLIGQTKVANSLKNAVLQNKIPTAYIFAGERGTGKTSSAFLLAKTLNCENLKENGDPCNNCDTCVAIDNNTQMGVSYISMANAQGVDSVREIAKNARLNQPIKKQVWILDEVHNLSKQAWDALLIPLEAKDMPSLFILCTTEINKIPGTITSRVQQRKFNLVKPEIMSSYVQKILKAEKVELTEEEINTAVRNGRGSVRDTLTALESFISTGESETSFGAQLLEALATRNITNILSVISEAHNESIDFKLFAEQLFEDLRELLLMASSVSEELITPPPLSDAPKVIKGLGGRAGILIFLSEVGDGLTRMNMGTDSRIIFEISLIKGLNSLKRQIAAAREK